MQKEVLALCLILLYGAQTAQAFDEGFYPVASTKNDSKDNLDSTFKQIYKTAENADRILNCRSIDEIDVGIGKTNKAGIRHPIYFKRSEVAHFLKNERKKDFIAVWFEKTMRFNDRNKTEMKSFLRKLGYKRFMILGYASNGVFVISDSSAK